MFLPFVSSEIETIRAIPFCLKEYSSADNKASAWYFSSFLHTSKWLFSVKFTLSEWGRFDVDEIRLSRPKTGDYAAEPRSTVAICRWSLSIVSFAQLPAIKEDFLFFVEGKTTISCSFLSSFSYWILKQFPLFLASSLLCIPSESCDSKYVIGSKGLSKFRMLIGFLKHELWQLRHPIITASNRSMYNLDQPTCV